MSGAYGRPAEQVDQGPRLVPFRGVRFAADGHDLTALTFVPPPAWSTVDAGAQPAGGLLGLLAPAFGVEDRSRESAAMLARWDADGLLVRDDTPAMYVYRWRGGDSVLTGLVAGVSLQQTSLVPHEEVIEAAVGRQHALAAATHAQLEPIVALVEEHGAAESLRRAVRQAVGGPPDRQLSEHGVTHEIWSVAASATHREVASGVGSAPLLVADGHHRLAAWSRLAQRAADPGASPWAYALTMLLDASQAALSLGLTYAKHASALMQAYPREESASTMTDEDAQLYKTLPEQFERAEGVQIADGLGVPDRSFDRRLNTWVKMGHIRRLRKGVYLKVDRQGPPKPS